MTNQRPVIFTMLISFMLLIGFVTYWLTQQYRNAETLLDKQLHAVVDETEKEVFDSLLVKSILSPLLFTNHDTKTVTNSVGDTINQQSLVSISHDSISERIQEINWNDNDIVPIGADSSNTAKIDIQFNVQDDQAEKSEPGGQIKKKLIFSKKFNTSIIRNGEPETSVIKSSKDSTTNFLLKGLNLLVKEISTGSKGLFNTDDGFKISPDTLLMDSLLQAKLAGQQLEITAVWKETTEKDSLSINPHQFKTTSFEPNYELIVEGRMFYLIRSILSEIAFVLFMIGVTGLAFYLAYRNIKRQQVLSEMKSDLINNMSHELKTPVSTVKVALEALADERVNQNQVVLNEYLGMANSELQRLEDLLDKVLNTSLLEKNPSIIKPEKIDLLQLIEETIGHARFKFDHGSSIYLKGITNEPVIVNGDKIHMQGALFNILDNAIKYAGKEAKVQVSLTKKNGEVVIDIEDNGPGISEEHLPRIFDKFYRISSGDVHNNKGYGLGLSYAKQVMLMHNGSITCRPKTDGSGCVFQLIFPL